MPLSQAEFLAFFFRAGFLSSSMARSTLTKRIEFSASHRYFKAEWDEARNKEVFGPCSQEHGHNYLLEVTLGGRVDPVTGMIINLYDLKEIVTDVLEEFDHKHLNFDMPYFERLVPTAENLALVLWRKFRERPETRDIESIRLCEGENLWAELYPPNDQASQDHAEPTEALLTRRYALTVKRNADASHVETWPLSLDVTLRGPIDPITGHVTNIMALDERVQEQVLNNLTGTNVSQHPELAARSATLPTLAKILWSRLIDVADARLERLRLTDHHNLTLDYSE